jgi:hypothetical protein
MNEWIRSDMYLASRQRGGKLRVQGWLLAVLLATATASAALNVYQYKHPRTVVYLMHPESGEIRKERADSGALDGEMSCTLSWSGCWKTA